MEKLKYGLLDEKLIHIKDVEKGLACNCICPHCKTQLVAKKGSKNTNHFAHYNLADCNHGTETALHLMAKEIIFQTCKVFVPHIPNNEYDFSPSGRLVVFDKAVLEKQLSDDVRGDVVLYSGERCLNVEIKVTHEVDLEKNIELFNLGIPTIEIDFSDLKTNFTPEIIEERINSGERTKLVFSPKGKEIFAKLLLGEWKKVYNSKYLKDCPITREKAYFMDYNNRGGTYQCHECESFKNYCDNGEDKYLCFGCLGGIEFDKVEKILCLEKEENHIIFAKLLMNDGSIVERNT